MTYWAVLCDRFICHWTVRQRRSAAIEAFMEDGKSKPWRQWQRDGYRCRKVTIEVQS
jgi:hypothetical protein